MLHPVTDPICAQFKNLQALVAQRASKYANASRLIDESDLPAAITAAARRFAEDLNLSQCAAALANAVVLDSVKTALLATLEADLVTTPAADLAAYQAEHEAVLRANGLIE